MRLLRKQVERFETEGYLFLPEVFTPHEAALLRRDAERVYALDR